MGRIINIAHQSLISLGEIGRLLAKSFLPHCLTRRLLHERDHFAPHQQTGFEGWYTRIQADDVSIVIIMCSLAPNKTHVDFDRQHYLHFSLVPLREGTLVPERIDLHLFPGAIIPVSTSPGSLPFTLHAPEFGDFVCEPQQQTYNLTLTDVSKSFIYKVRVTIKGRTALDVSDELRTPHGAFASLETTLPLHWAIFSVRSHAQVEITRRPIKPSPSNNMGVDGEVEEVDVWRGVGRAHLEKNWGVSFPEGWTWSQASSPGGFYFPLLETPNLSPSRPVSLALAGGQIFGHKAFMIHFASPSRTLMFAPPYTVILAIPLALSRLWSRFSSARSASKVKSKEAAEERRVQWGPWTTERYDNVKGTLRVETANLYSKLVVDVEASEPPTSTSWLALYCPLPGGHSTSAFETFTATMKIQVYTRLSCLPRCILVLWPWSRDINGRGEWTLQEEHVLPDAALEFGGVYWSAKGRALTI